MGILSKLFGLQPKEPRFKPFTPRTAEQLQEEFSRLYHLHFPEYTVYENVPASSLRADCHPACTPVQFLFCREDRPLLAVVLVAGNTYRGRNVVGTRELCEEQGIAYLRFFVEMPNEAEYVVERTRQHLAGCAK